MIHILDKINQSILKVIQKNGRISNQKLAESVNLSPSPCLQRHKHLEKKGIIEGYEAKINLDKISRHVFVWTEISLKHNKLTEEKLFENYIQKSPCIVKAIAVGGDTDYFVLYCVPSIEYYQNETYKLIEETNVIESLTSNFIMRDVKKFEGYPLDILLNDDIEA